MASAIRRQMSEKPDALSEIGHGCEFVKWLRGFKVTTAQIFVVDIEGDIDSHLVRMGKVSPLLRPTQTSNHPSDLLACRQVERTNSIYQSVAAICHQTLLLISFSISSFFDSGGWF
jgi:hypothetical protein